MKDYKQSSMVDIAYDIMSKRNKPQDFYTLWEEVALIKGYDDEEKDRFESLFYTNITLDGRLITLGENTWDLRKRHKFEDVHIDMNAVYSDEDSEESEEEDDGLIEDDYNQSVDLVSTF